MQTFLAVLLLKPLYFNITPILLHKTYRSDVPFPTNGKFYCYNKNNAILATFQQCFRKICHLSTSCQKWHQMRIRCTHFLNDYPYGQEILAIAISDVKKAVWLNFYCTNPPYLAFCIRRTLCRHVTIGTPMVIFAVWLFFTVFDDWYTVLLVQYCNVARVSCNITGSPVDRDHRLASYDTSLVVSGGFDCGRRRRNVYDKK